AHDSASPEFALRGAGLSSGLHGAFESWSTHISLWFYGARIHEHLPDMAVEVLKAMPVHEPIVLGFHVGAAAGRDRLRDQFVHLPTVLARKRDQHLRTLGGIRNGLGGELLELRVSQQHDVSVFAQDYAGGGFVGELSVEVEAEFPEEIFGL